MKTGFLLLILLIFQTNLFAQWTTNTTLNTPICTDASKQVDPRIMEDGVGGAYITWKDYRPSNGLPDIYIQRVDAKGIAKWTTDGIDLCNDIADQSTPAIETDMKGGAIVAWSDWRSNIERDIYAQRVDSNGNIKWTVNGANVTDLPFREHSEKIVSDGFGGIIIIFEKQVSGVWDIWGQRLDSLGNKMWGQGGIAMCTVATNRRNHRVQKDRNGGAIVSWQDLRNGLDYDVYAQRINGNGTLLWGTSAKPVCTAVGDQINAKIDPDSATNGAIIAWQDTRNSADYDIYIQKIDSNGNQKWASNGVVVCNASGNQSALDFLTIDATSETIITWKDNRNGNDDIYAQKMNGNGIAQWTVNGIVICNSQFDQINPNICSDQNNGAIIVWQDSTTLNNWDIKSQHINNAGQALWTANGVIVSNAIGEQNGPKNVTDNKGGTIVCWQDKRTGIFDIYAQHLFASGSPNTINDFFVEQDLKIFPNPVKNELNIFVENNHTINEIQLIDCVGKIIREIKNPMGNKLTIDVQNLSKGIYLLIATINQQTISKKIVKE